MEIYILETGTPQLAIIKESFDNGPLLLNEQRLDLLENVEVLLNSSTMTTYGTGDAVSKSSSGSMIGRGVLGAVIAGPTFGLVAALSGEKKTTIQNVSTEVVNLEVTIKLTFSNNFILNALIKDQETYQFLLSMITTQPMKEEDYFHGYELEKQKLLRLKAEESEKKLIWEEVDKTMKLYDASNSYTPTCIMFSIVGCLIGLYYEYIIIGVILGFLFGHLYEDIKKNKNQDKRLALFNQLKSEKKT
ncbi:hypothetical protein [Colwellia sp. BRX8-9]|uniref:hypothetical protein n=1 Tax=Colwellia sp. BRX8-9 TaxID=2759831 RepID=UPI0015F5772A|nr:hypothetical protein [Colwellia sp. BRX8-9]MBA6347078.1 hypothetical protein [Colwellia sp. BRX8-9]